MNNNEPAKPIAGKDKSKSPARATPEKRKLPSSSEEPQLAKKRQCDREVIQDPIQRLKNLVYGPDTGRKLSVHEEEKKRLARIQEMHRHGLIPAPLTSSTEMKAQMEPAGVKSCPSRRNDTVGNPFNLEPQKPVTPTIRTCGEVAGQGTTVTPAQSLNTIKIAEENVAGSKASLTKSDVNGGAQRSNNAVPATFQIPPRPTSGQLPEPRSNAGPREEQRVLNETEKHICCCQEKAQILEERAFRLHSWAKHLAGNMEVLKRQTEETVRQSGELSRALRKSQQENREYRDQRIKADVELGKLRIHCEENVHAIAMIQSMRENLLSTVKMADQVLLRSGKGAGPNRESSDPGNDQASATREVEVMTHRGANRT